MPLAISGGMPPSTRARRNAARRPVPAPPREWIAPHYLLAAPSCVEAGCPVHDPETAPGVLVPPAEPRSLLRVGDRMELSGALSCRSYARACLLDPEALALEACEPAAGEGLTPAREIPAGDVPPWERYIDDIRVTLLGLLAVPETTLSARLFLAATFAQRVQPFYYRGVEVFEESALAREIDRIQDPAEQAALIQQFGELKLPRTVGLRAAAEILGNRAQFSTVLPFRRLIADAFQSLPVAPGDEGVREEDILRYWTERQAPWVAAHGPLLAQAFGNYAGQYFLREPFTASPNLLIYMEQLAVRLTVLRFLLAFHPALAGGAEDADAAGRLQQTLVEVVSLAVRAIDDDPPFLRECEAALARAGVLTLGHTVLLLGS